MGESGSGKTTLLNILAALDKPTSGAVRLSGGDITKIKDSKMSQFRREHLGFVFQDFNLLDTFSLRDNIFLPLVLLSLIHICYLKIHASHRVPRQPVHQPPCTPP